MSIHDALERMPLFHGLPKEQITKLTRIVAERNSMQGEIVFSEGDEAKGFYILLGGRVKVFKLSPEGKEQILHIIEPGEPFAEVAMFAGSTYPAHAETLKESKLIFFPRGAFENLIKKDPDLAMNMLAILSQRLKYFSRLVEDLSLKEVPQRLAAYLLYLSDSRQDAPLLHLGISKGQLASLLGTIPETLSRILNKMVAQGFIEVRGRQVKILKRDDVAVLASGERLLN
jgi:CRP/FNR family transcriptional regulator, dissimilatory nitrate respiration regulator